MATKIFGFWIFLRKTLEKLSEMPYNKEKAGGYGVSANLRDNIYRRSMT